MMLGYLKFEQLQIPAGSLTSYWFRKWFILTCSSMYKWSEFSLIQARSHQMKSQSSLLEDRQGRLPSRCNKSRKENSTISRLPDSLFSFYPTWSLVQDVQCDVECVTSVAHAPSSIPEETPVTALVNKHAQDTHGKRKNYKTLQYLKRLVTFLTKARGSV